MKFTSTLILAAFSTLAFTAVPACDDKKDDKKAEDKKDAKGKAEEKKADDKKAPPAEEKKADAPAEEKKADAAPAGDAPAGGGDKIGVAECDDFVTKYAKCINEKVPEAARAGAQQGMDAMVKGFKDMAAGPGKDGLAAACKSALDATKQSMGPMGCEF
jgi:hypothetical protein